MPLVAHKPLPSFDYLRDKGEEVLTLQEAMRQDIRELHIGFLNMMPDAALHVTERQFMRLVGSSNQIAQFYVHPFTVPGLQRGAETQAYIDHYYLPFEQLQKDGLDALIITGANIIQPRLEKEAFWEPLKEVIGWATENVTSVLCSCLATHALVKYLYGIERMRLPRKRWGVYSHRVTQFKHPLLRGINTRFDVPHSRYNAITRKQFEDAGLTVLIESRVGGVHMAVSADQLRIVFLQGHPEYDYHSLLKEYKREVMRFLNGKREEYPSHPFNYFSEEAAKIADKYQEAALVAMHQSEPAPPFPEEELGPVLDNTWRDTGRAFFNNWLGLVYKLTNIDRRMPFVEGIDPNDPLGWRDS